MFRVRTNDLLSRELLTPAGLLLSPLMVWAGAPNELGAVESRQRRPSLAPPVAPELLPGPGEYSERGYPGSVPGCGASRSVWFAWCGGQGDCLAPGQICGQTRSGP